MPFVDNRGIQIHYEARGAGDPLLLVHGMFVNWKWWRETGFVEALHDACRLILVDVRGHGLSSKPTGPESYRVRELVGDLTLVLDDVGVNQAHYLGYSMGGWLGFAAAKYAPARFSSFILGGIHPYSDLPGHQVKLDSLRQTGMDSIVAWFEKSGPMTKAQRRDLRSNDVAALLALTHIDREDYRNILPDLAVPCLLYCGDADVRHGGARTCAQELPDATFVSLSGYDHLEVKFHASGEILPHISRFLSRPART